MAQGELSVKKISVVIPTYNEQDNVKQICSEIVKIFAKELGNYDYELIFIDNYSEDKTREYLAQLCSENKKVKAIFNAKNFGNIRSSFYGMLQATGDCTIGMCADFQDPPEMIPKFVKEWENGYKIVTGKKFKSHENQFIYFLRGMYYKFIKKIAEVKQLEQFTGFGLYDRTFMDVLRSLNDPMPYMRGMVAELGYGIKEIEYVQPKRRAGKTSNNWYTLYDMAMLGITSYTKVVMRCATISGFLISGISFLVAIYYFIMKLANWDKFTLGTAPIIISIFLLGSIQLFFIGFLGEYILNINTRVMKRPFVIEEKRINMN
jgi:glycosyltransferase involved in cell wall biosynthesis